MKKDDHSPLDSAVFAILNSAVFGFVFSLSMFNKNYESSNFSFKKKLGFMGRNILVISSLHGLNQYLIKLTKSRTGLLFFRNYLGLRNEIIINLFSSLISTSLPAYLAYKIYYYKNAYILIEKKFFLGIGVVFFLFDYFNSGAKFSSKIKMEEIKISNNLMI
jgi:hypothetical protein